MPLHLLNVRDVPLRDSEEGGAMATPAEYESLLEAVSQMISTAVGSTQSTTSQDDAPGGPPAAEAAALRAADRLLKDLASKLSSMSFSERAISRQDSRRPSAAPSRHQGSVAATEADDDAPDLRLLDSDQVQIEALDMIQRQGYVLLVAALSDETIRVCRLEPGKAEVVQSFSHGRWSAFRCAGSCVGMGAVQVFSWT